MTQMSQAIVTCSCGTTNKIIYYSSINTNLNENLLDDLLAGTLNTCNCKSCGQIITIEANLLINCPQGMIWVSTAEKPSRIKEVLIEKEVIDESGKLKVPVYEKFTPTELEDYIEQKNLSENDKEKLRDYIKRKRKFDWRRSLYD